MIFNDNLVFTITLYVIMNRFTEFQIISSTIQNIGIWMNLMKNNNSKWDFFSGIINGKMNLSGIGEIAQSKWLKTFDMRPDMNLWMGEYIIMPNHFHALIGIGGK